jgi:hypothetical protein
MSLKNAFVFICLLALTLPITTVTATKKRPQSETEGQAVMWREPRDIESRDLFLGPGGVAHRPNLKKIKVIKKEEKGSSLKYRIEDASGKEWIAKIGSEAQAETAAVRLLWAIGYPTEINYLVKKITLPDVGTFENVRLEARPEGIKRVGDWTWEQNPFTGKRELQGLKIMMLLMNNWDIKDDNNDILVVEGRPERQYIISDLGATFGRTGNKKFPMLWLLTRSRNNVKDYHGSTFIEKVEGDRVKFYYAGKMRGLFEDITLDDAAWISTYLTRLSREQISNAFRAANYTKQEVSMLTEEVEQRISNLNQISKGRTVARNKRVQARVRRR